MKVNQLADHAASSKNSTFLASIFKKGVMNKFKHLRYGSIEIIEGDEILSFGDTESDDKVTVTIHSNEFYVFRKWWSNRSSRGVYGRILGGR